MLAQNPAWEGGEGGERAEDAAGAGEAAQRPEEDDADLAPDEAEIDQARAKQEEQANVDEITRAGDAPLSPAGPPRLGGSLADGALVGVADATEAARKFKEETAKGRRELRDAGAKWYILHPDAPALLIWDTIQAVVIFFLFIELPIRYGFFVTTLQIAAACEEQYVFLGPDWVDRCADDAAGGGPALETKGLSETHCIDCGSHVQEASTISEHELSDYLVDILMMLDWLLRFVRAFYDYDYHGQRHLRVSLTRITKHYAQNNMIRDTLACWPLDTIFILADHPQFASAVRLLRLLRMERVIDFKRSVDSYVDAAVGKDWLRPVISGVSLILGTFFFNHVLCCVLYRLGSELYDEVDCSQWETDRCGWVARQDYRDGIDWDVKYGDAFYYSFTILTTVGFGDISAHSTLERIATVFAMTAGCAIFGIVMGQITAVIHGMNMGLAHYEERVRELEQYMAFRDVNPTVRERVKRFLVEKYPEKRVYDERQILGTLPVGLRTEFLQDMYKDMVEVLPFIPAGDHEVLTAVCRIMRQEVIMPGEIIVREGVALRQVFTVVSGEVAVAVPFVAEDAVAALKPAEWMLTDLQLLALNDEVGSASGLTDGELAEEKKAQDILERTIAGGKSVWSDEHDYPCLPGHANPDEDARRGSVREEKQSLRHANTIRAQRLEREATAAAQAAGNDLEWLTLALLREGHYFCEQCLTYDAPSFKRYTARHLSSIGKPRAPKCTLECRGAEQ